MKTTKSLKLLLSEAYEVEGELIQLIEQCFKEMFKENSIYMYSLFEDDLESGRDYNGCLQPLDFYKRQVEEHKIRVESVKNSTNQEDDNE